MRTAPARASRAEPREGSRDDVTNVTNVGDVGDVGQWLYAPSWRRAPLREGEPAGGPSHWLVFADEGAVASQLVGRLEQAGQSVTLVRSGLGFEHLAARAFTLRPDRPEDYQALGRELGAGSPWPTHVVHAFGLGEASEAGLDAAEFWRAQGRGALSLLWSARLLGQRPERTSLVVLANGLHDLTGREALRPEQAPLLGACRSVSLEYPHLRCRLLDLEAARPAPAELEWLADRVVAEARSEGDAAVALYRGRHRWVPSVEPVALSAAPEAPPLLRDRGAYLITGGLGGVGLWAADYLARTVRARLLLTGRSAPTEEQRARLKALEELGAEVLVVQADVTDVAAMQAAANQGVDRFGALHGMLHAAGVAEGGFIERLTGEALEAEFAPKAYGALALREIARRCRPDFVLLCSSLTALSGGVARAGYAAANAFLDALAQAAAREGEPYTVSVNFDRWQHVGMAARAEARLVAAGMGDVILGGMTPEQGQQVFHRVFGQRAMPQVIVSTRPLGALPKDDEGAALAGRLGIGRAGAVSGGGDRAPGAALGPVPAEALASQVAEIWARAFGLERVDAGQDFFALGGESLLALQILNRVRDVFGVELSLREFFERPTAAGLAGRVQAARARGAGGEGPA
ncbi:MAG TPA: SDR family NAD(P)-dependent oxidoreductase, partial [Polyangiaceae bacterium]|nr:SDR family NAD(P)-dependent oxidoreductase [Polyangiaceae bacterium]